MGEADQADVAQVQFDATPRLSIRERIIRRGRVALLALALVGCGKGNIERNEDLSEFDIPDFRSECIYEIDGHPSFETWDSVLDQGQGAGLTPDEVTVDELAEFNGKNIEDDVVEMPAVDVCVDGREHGYVGFYGDMDASYRPVQETWFTPTPTRDIPLINTFKKPSVEKTVRPSPTPRPTANIVYDSELDVHDVISSEVSSCQERSTFKLSKSVASDIPEDIDKTTNSTATLVDGGYFTTSAHGVVSVRGRKKVWSVVNEDGSSEAEYTLTDYEGNKVSVLGGLFDYDKSDIAILFADHDYEPCLQMGSIENASRLDPIRLTNYGAGGEVMRKFRARFVGVNPADLSTHLFIDGIDGDIKYKGEDRNETMEPGGSGGNILHMPSELVIGVSVSHFHRGSLRDHSSLTLLYRVDSDEFNQFGGFQSTDSVVDLIVDYLGDPQDSSAQAIYELQHRLLGGDGLYEIAGHQRMSSEHEEARE